MVMVSNDVPSTLGNLGSLRDGRPPSLLRDCASTCPGEKQSQEHTLVARRGDCSGEKQKVKPRVSLQRHLAPQLKEDVLLNF